MTLLFSIVLITSSDDPSALERKEDPLKSPQSDISRPSSAPTVGSKSSPKPPRISSSEQADIDRYVERQLGLRKKEKDDLLQMKLYEQELRERKTTSCAPCILHLCNISFSLGTIRASKGSMHAVDEMLKRQEEHHRKSTDKFLEKKAALEKEEVDRIEHVKQQRRAVLSKPPPSKTIKFKDISYVFAFYAPYEYTAHCYYYLKKSLTKTPNSCQASRGPPGKKCKRSPKREELRGWRSEKRSWNKIAPPLRQR